MATDAKEALKLALLVGLLTLVLAVLKFVSILASNVCTAPSLI